MKFVMANGVISEGRVFLEKTKIVHGITQFKVVQYQSIFDDLNTVQKTQPLIEF